ncbi:hypothetical protein BN863_29590 [Formosa agariphila KMM 3901]|uniref:Uncharacterized protein n=1 Tax=Formosa agariphila (strain DSM 15362 / KCTC 12365 / LMG 23005 / KMM 3901 / M-2Alg 35-1) TaxID=1347342 RepID=T2KQD7_FORAG|nr:hypothetical protein BN863_29590 [Formosa agariphila KMM 3901]
MFFFLNLFSLFIFCIKTFHSCIGYNSKHGLKTERFTTNPSCNTALNCFFSETGNINLPFASTLHSYVPINEFKTIFGDYILYLSNILKNIPLFTTIYHFVNKFLNTTNAQRILDTSKTSYILS